jgi:YD repeat-containing protein
LIALAAAVPVSAQSGQDPENDVDEFLAYVTKPEIDAAFTDSVDPFSGYLHISMVDIRLPGRAGLDLVIQRYYSSNIWRRVDYQNMWDVSTHTPFYDQYDNLGSSGWQMHMGKVINPNGQGSPNLLRDNPVLIMPDGSTHKFYSKAGGGGLISKERWTYIALNSQSWEVTSIDGTRYRFEFGWTLGYHDLHNSPVAQCTRITDVNGNQISIEYGAGRLYRITDTEGRTVEFEYHNDTATHRIQFIRVKHDNQTLQTWEYRYQLQGTIYQPGHAGWSARNIHALTEVRPPETTTSGLGAWRFEYFGTENDKATGMYTLKRVTFPGGGRIGYRYAPEMFDVGVQACQIPFSTVSERTLDGRGVAAGTWTYSYSNPGTNNAVTVVNAPENRTERYEFFGWEPYTIDYHNIWRVGLLKKSTITEPLQTVIEEYEWTEGDRLSFDYLRTTNWIGCGSERRRQEVRFVRPNRITRTVTREGRDHVTRYENFDRYGHAERITETGDLSRTTTRAFFFNTSKNILDGRETSRSASPGGSRQYQYDSFGRTTRETINSISTTYAYDSFGRLASTTDANGKSTYLDTYKFGIATRVRTPDSNIKYFKQVNPAGTVASETDGRAGCATCEPRTRYEYDRLNRLTRVNPPGSSSVAADISITYAPSGSEAAVSRGSFDLEYLFDGYGRLMRVENELGHIREMAFNAIGRKIQIRY